MNAGWKCPNCGKAHGPHIDTCPEQGKTGAPLPYRDAGRQCKQCEGKACLNASCPKRVIVAHSQTEAFQ